MGESNVSLISLIRQNEHALTAANAGNWEMVADILNVKNVVVHDVRPVSMARTLVALAEAGIDSEKVIEQFESNPLGRGGLIKLAGEGLDYGHPITAALLSKMVGAGLLPQSTVDVLTGLSVSMTSLAETTAEECRAEWASSIRRARNESLMEQFSTILNQIGTSEQADGIAALRAMADELEKA